MIYFLRSKSFWIPSICCAVLLLINIPNTTEQLLLTALTSIVISMIFGGFLFGGILYIINHKVR